jgi:hypothetical protein
MTQHELLLRALTALVKVIYEDLSGKGYKGEYEQQIKHVANAIEPPFDPRNAI